MVDNSLVWCWLPKGHHVLPERPSQCISAHPCLWWEWLRITKGKGHHQHHHYNDLLSKLKRGKRIDNNLKVKTRLGRQKTKWEILASLWNYFDSKLKNVKTDFSGRCWRAPPELLIVTSLQSPQNLVSSWQLVVIGIILVHDAISSWGNINHKITFSFANFPLNTRRTLLEEVAEERKNRRMIISDLKYQLIH